MVTLKLDDRRDADRYDIVESFEALDRQKTGRLEFEQAYSLLLGLGYITDYKKKDEFDPTALQAAARRIESVQNENYNDVDFQSGIKLETLLTVVDTVRACLRLPSLATERNHKKRGEDICGSRC